MSVSFGLAVGLVEVRVYTKRGKEKKKSSTQSSEQQKQQITPTSGQDGITFFFFLHPFLFFSRGQPGNLVLFYFFVPLTAMQV